MYKTYCLSAFKQLLNSLLFAEDLCTCIEHQMERLLPSIDMGFETSAQLHSSNVKSLPRYWTQLKTYTTCLFWRCGNAQNCGLRVPAQTWFFHWAPERTRKSNRPKPPISDMSSQMASLFDFAGYCGPQWMANADEGTWRDVTNWLDDNSRADYFRLNVPFEGEEPRLDDIQFMDELRRSVQLEPTVLRDRSGIVFALLVASFFFELAAIPTFEANHYICQGFVRCRNGSRAVLESLTRLQGTTMLEFVNENEGLGTLILQDICPLCHMYSKKVQFYVRHLDDVICIKLRVHGWGQRKISGFPHNLAWFVSQ